MVGGEEDEKLLNIGGRTADKLVQQSECRATRSSRPDIEIINGSKRKAEQSIANG